jgi:hypothetical protein
VTGQAKRLVLGTRLRAGTVPVGTLVRTIHTRRLAVVTEQIRGYATILDWGLGRELKLHPECLLEVATDER